VATGKPIGARMVHTNGLERAQFNAQGTRLFTRAKDNLAWDAGTGEPAPFPVSGPDAVEDFYVSQKAEVALAGGRIWEWAEDRSRSGVRAAAGRPSSSPQAAPVGEPLVDASLLAWASFSPDGDRVLTASRDRTARIWDTVTGKPVTPLLSHDRAVGRCEFSPDGRRVLTMSEDHLTRVWDAGTGRPVTPPIGHAAYGNASAFSGSGRYLLTIHPEFLVCVWDLREGPPPVSLRPIRVACASSSTLGRTHILTGKSHRLTWSPPRARPVTCCWP
jgi:WD40 repeat protein